MGDEKKRVGLPWVERYRPGDLGSVVGNEDAVKGLRLIAQNGHFPTMILAGSPGTGKTTSIICLATSLFGGDKSLLREAFMELNASDSRGIDVVRDKIRAFARKKVTFPREGLYKIVLLDEVDSMTTPAQQGLRRIIDLYGATTRFALACNTISKVADTVQSRCVILHFRRITDDAMRARLQEIAEAEKIDHLLSEDGMQALLFVADGDLRLAINTMQAVASGLGQLSAENVYKIADLPQANVAANLLSLCLKGDAVGACAEMQLLWKRGYAPIDIISTLHKVAKNAPFIPEHTRTEFIHEIALSHAAANEGLNSLLQLNALLARLAARTPTSSK